jgi:hypothetical protein
VRSVAPVRNEVQTPQYKAEVPVVYPGAERPMTEDELRTSLGSGEGHAVKDCRIVTGCRNQYEAMPDGILKSKPLPHVEANAR